MFCYGLPTLQTQNLINDTTKKGLFDEIINVINILELDINDINPRALYTPCGCHSLNLVLCDMTNSCLKANHFLELYNAYIHCFLLQQKDGKFYKIICQV